MTDLLCYLCCKPALDARAFIEVDPDGTRWVYCRPCDTWTEHPAEDD